MINLRHAPFIAHRYLYNHVGILHSDLSVNNVLLNREDNESEAVGLLIDYDHSIEADSKAENRRDMQLVAGNSDTHAVEGPPIGERVADTPLHPSGRSAASTGAAHSLTPRTVRCAHLL